MMRLQHDNYNYRASESLPLMLDLLDTTDMKGHRLSAYQLLRKWDYFSNPERLAPSVYEAWWNALYPMIWDEFQNQEVSLIRPHVYNTIHLMNNDSISEFFDIRSTSKVEELADLVNDSYNKAIAELDQWKAENGDYEWYKFKSTGLQHLLRLDAFSFDDVKIGGNRNIVNAASAKHGPSWRMVVELGKSGVRAWGTYPGSQTGNPGNPGYGGFIDGWASGKYHSLNFLKSKDEESPKIIFTQTIKAD